MLNLIIPSLLNVCIIIIIIVLIQPLFILAKLYLNTGFYWRIYPIWFISEALITLLKCWHSGFIICICATDAYFPLQCSFRVAVYMHNCVCSILRVWVYIYLWLCGLLPATHGRARQLNTGGNGHSVCLWNSNVSKQRLRPKAMK